jgi:tRNA-splicing ligase RtcB
MMAKTLTGKTLQKLGYPQGPIIGSVIERFELFPVEESFLKDLWEHPENYSMDDDWEDVAKAIMDHKNPPPDVRLNLTPAPNKVWGRDIIDDATMAQFHMACRLPIAAQGAQMPDGHLGYGLPIGGVLGVRDAVIPYAVGVDIACRMRMTIFSDPVSLIYAPMRENLLRKALKTKTAFGIGAHFKESDRRDHEMMEDKAWFDVPWLRTLKDRAWAQLGSSGSGNHFVEFGILNTEGIPELGVEKGQYLSLLSHSGSRSFGNEIAKHYTDIAMKSCRLPEEAKHLAWLNLDTHDGWEYWEAMNLAGRYSSANHEIVHRYVAEDVGLQSIAVIENHHNFAWKEEHNGEDLIVHRKGATPASKGELGVIPGTMADVTHVVRGLGNPDSLNSASHGAGRQMSRKKANQTIDRNEVKKLLEEAHVDLISAGLDESPQAYKPIAEVMEAQRDLVESVAEFRPRIVIMAAAGERAED